jgi:hypothetical protein
MTDAATCEDKALELRASGKSFAAIAKTLGYERTHHFLPSTGAGRRRWLVPVAGRSPPCPSLGEEPSSSSCWSLPRTGICGEGPPIEWRVSAQERRS